MRRPPPSAADRAGMVLALAEARAAAAADAVPVGAVVMRGGEVLARAHNGAAHPLAHAETLALHRALEVAGDDRLRDATLYVTLEPCAMCSGAIVLAKVGRVVFGADDPKAGMAGSLHDLLRDARLNHRPEVVRGVLAEECGALLRDFFSVRR
ncbi:MAG: nucleoside deaminase [Gemmatimonadales bacterium]|nr:nucleoside deaminase [Gemmatimonadales bacterium]